MEKRREEWNYQRRMYHNNKVMMEDERNGMKEGTLPITPMVGSKRPRSIMTEVTNREIIDSSSKRFQYGGKLRAETNPQYSDKADIYITKLPPGCRFSPSDKELVKFYLKNKIMNRPLPLNVIKDVDIYGYHPDQLVENYKACDKDEWYFFSPREKKYPNGCRPNRIAKDGYWKATGKDKLIKINNVVEAKRKTLVFYNFGKVQKGEKTSWIMQEFRLNDEAESRNRAQKLNIALCKIYKARAKKQDDEDECQNPSFDSSQEDVAEMNEANLSCPPHYQGYQNDHVFAPSINAFQGGFIQCQGSNVEFTADDQTDVMEPYLPSAEELKVMVDASFLSFENSDFSNPNFFKQGYQLQPQHHQDQLQQYCQYNQPQGQCQEGLNFPPNINQFQDDCIQDSNIEFKADDQTDVIEPPTYEELATLIDPSLLSSKNSPFDF